MYVCILFDFPNKGSEQFTKEDIIYKTKERAREQNLKGKLEHQYKRGPPRNIPA